MMPRCRCLSVALVCACVAQGVKAPSAAVISFIVSPAPVVVASSTASVNSGMTVVDTVSGKLYDVRPAQTALRRASAPTETPLASTIWPPPDRSKA